VEPTAIPRSAFYTGAALMILIDEDTEIVGDQKIYGIMPVCLCQQILFSIYILVLLYYLCD
jgi:hypothetical protein